MLSLRQVTRREPGRGGTDRQVHILTTRGAGDLPAAGVACRMASRWREENYFRYARAHFALDALVITHVSRMAACNAEIVPARALHGHYARAWPPPCGR